MCKRYFIYFIHCRKKESALTQFSIRGDGNQRSCILESKTKKQKGKNSTIRKTWNFSWQFLLRLKLVRFIFDNFARLYVGCPNFSVHERTVNHILRILTNILTSFCWFSIQSFELTTTRAILDDKFSFPGLFGTKTTFTLKKNAPTSQLSWFKLSSWRVK